MTFLEDFDRAPNRYARMVGIAYLAIIAIGLFGEVFVRGTMVVSGDPAATANNIATSPGLWRAAIAGDLLMHVLDVPMIVIFYLLLRPVGRNLALFATAANLVQTAVLAANKLTLVLPLFLLGNTDYVNAVPALERQFLAYTSIQAHAYGFGIGLIFFGVACLARGVLILRAEYLPRFLGYLLFAAGVAYLFNSFALLLAPDVASTAFPVFAAVAFVGEFSLALWLVAKGVNLPAWTTRLSQKLQ
jgi:hypothetical protein